MKVCVTMEDQTSDFWPVIETFLQFAYQWSWFYLNLACLTKQFTIEILYKDLKMNKQLILLYQMIGLISDLVVQRSGNIEKQEVDIKIQILWALKNLQEVDKEIFETTMFENGLLKMLIDDISESP